MSKHMRHVVYYDDQESVSFYEGTCPKCGRIKTMRLLSSLIPPPAILATCQCEIPVNTVQLFYKGMRQ